MTELVHREAAFLLYQTEDGRTRVEARLDAESAWLSLGQMAALLEPVGRSKHGGRRPVGTVPSEDSDT